MKIQRYRITFSKTEAMRFTGHLDLILTWERTFRRAGLPLAYSEGFSSRPVLNMATPLPLGYTSTAEVGDFWLSKIISRDIFQNSLERSLPPGLIIHTIQEIEHIHGPKLPALTEASVYTIELKTNYPDLSGRISEILQSAELYRERKGKKYDLRPLIKSISIINQNSSIPGLQVTLTTHSGATGRPDEVLRALDIPPEESKICRTQIILKEGVE
ncbi:MAG: TIGR03936 family radical SAM-associated protein [Anaerolineales bacterium]|nr:TIGR03936 family radical SAM-associated protein [Anaerolineales bacterium]